MSVILYYKIFSGCQTNELSLRSLNKIQKEFSDLGISFNDTEKSKEKQSTSSSASSSDESLSVRWPSFAEFESNCKDINEHFEHIARQLSNPYIELIAKILSVKPRSGMYSSKHGALAFPSEWSVWSQEAGWTRYDAASGRAERVLCPLEAVLVFDVETLVAHNSVPVLAAALSPNAWYSWCSP